MWLTCKVIKKWQPPPPFQVCPAFLAKNFVTPPPLVTQFSEGPTPPPFLIKGGGRSNYEESNKNLPLFLCFFKNQTSCSMFYKNLKFDWNSNSQGCVLGPTHFLQYINDLPADVICSIAIYAGHFCVFWFSYLLVHLLMKSICYLVVFQMVIVGCWAVYVLLFFEAVFATESASSFSSIPWWTGQHTNLFCTFGLMSMRFSWIALIVELW